MPHINISITIEAKDQATTAQQDAHRDLELAGAGKEAAFEGSSGDAGPRSGLLRGEHSNQASTGSWGDQEGNLREALEAAILDACPTWESDFDGGPGQVVSVKDAATIMRHWIMDHFDWDRYEFPGWQPPISDPRSIAEFLTRAGHPVRVRVSSREGAVAWLSTVRAQQGAHLTKDEALRVASALVELVARREGFSRYEILFMTATDPRGKIDLTLSDHDPEKCVGCEPRAAGGCICDRKEGQPGYGLLCPIHGDPISRKNMTEQTLPELLQEMHATRDTIVEQILAEPGPSIKRGGMQWRQPHPGEQEAFRIAQDDPERDTPEEAVRKMREYAATNLPDDGKSSDAD